MKRSLLALLALCVVGSTGFAQNTSGDNLWLYTVNGSGEAELVGITQYYLDELVKPLYRAGFEVPAEVDGYPLTTIGRTAFENVRGLPFGEIAIYGATRVEAGAFEYLQVKNVVFWNEPLIIGNGAFYQSKVEYVYLSSPNTQVTIGSGAFYFAEWFRGFRDLSGEDLGWIPPGTTSIGDNPWAENDAMPSDLAIPSGISHIGQWFLYSSMRSLIIPDTVTRVRVDAFRSYYSPVQELLFKGSPPDAPFDFSGTIYRLPGASGWSNSFGGVPVKIFLEKATAIGMSPALGGFKFSWSESGGSFPVNVERAPSPGGPWTVVSSNNYNGQFTDPNPPSGSAFYRAQATIP
jgi:hypothetical protein